MYSYLFGDYQYSKHFELAAENLFQEVLDEAEKSPDSVDVPVDEDVPANVPPMQNIDFTKDEFDPFNVNPDF